MKFTRGKQGMVQSQHAAEMADAARDPLSTQYPVTPLEQPVET